MEVSVWKMLGRLKIRRLIVLNALIEAPISKNVLAKNL